MTAKNKQTTASQVASVISIPGYKIKDLLGRGGMATVYLAVQESIGREVALKILSPDHTDDTFSERFLREARIASQLSHPNIITVFDAGIHNGIHYMSMEYIKGKSFNAARDLLSRKDKIRVIKEMAQALDFAGKKGFVHRDIKPENILLHQDGRAILTDFGIARANDVSKGLTETGKILGTPYFMSPEQTKGLQIDQRTDIYSLGVVLFQALAGYVPYDGPSIVAICIKHLSDPIPQLPKGMEIFQPIINICLSKKPEHRYQSASELYDALNKISDTQIDSLDKNIPTAKKPVSNPNDATLVEPQINNPQAVQAKTAAPVKKAVKSRPVERSSISSKRNVAERPGFITDSDDFKNLNRRKKRLLWILIAIAIAVGYYNKTELLRAWKSKGEPLAKQYLPSEIKKYLFKDNIAKQQAKKIIPKPVKLTKQEILAKKIQALTTSLDKIPGNARELSALLTAELKKQPQDKTLKKHITKLEQWYLTRLQKLLDKKAFTGLEKTITDIKTYHPEMTKSEEYYLIEQQYALDKVNEPHLQKARVYFAVNAFNKPAGANAQEELRIVLQRDPENREALQGLDKIMQHFKREAKNYQQKNKLFKALNAVNAGLQAVSDDAELIDMQKIIKRSINSINHAKTLLLQADRQLADGNLISPEHTSAYALYMRVLASSPDNKRAKAGLVKIQKSILNSANSAINDNKFREADKILSNALRLFENNAQIQAARNRLQKEMDAVLPIVPRIQISTIPINTVSQTSIQKIKPGQLLYVGFEFKNFTQPITNLKVNVYNGDKPTLIVQKAITINGKQGQHFFQIKLPTKGISNGNYSIELIFGESRLIKANLYGLH